MNVLKQFACFWIVFYSLITLTSTAQPRVVNAGWTSDPFANREFIENKGQFTAADNLSNRKILFAVNSDGVRIYFDSHGLIWRHDIYKKADGLSTSGSIDVDEQKGRVEKCIIKMEWEGGNPDVEIIPGEKLSYYYTYPDPSDRSDLKTIIAGVYKTITYKNIYPNIDVEYYFPTEREGIKYNVILRPGADLSLIKMKYSGANKLVKNDLGNVVVSTAFGIITDHAPVTFANGAQIPSAFEVQGKRVTFKITGTYDNSETIVIDPWTTSPAFTTNKAFDVDYDKTGNVYAYGSFAPYQLVKLSPAGAVLWKYNATLFVDQGWYCYGDMAVDYNTGMIYLVEGANSTSGAQALKLNGAGTQKAYYGGSTQMTEMWRISLNYCSHKAVIAGGGVFSNYQACILDTSLKNLTPVNMLAATQSGHDFSLLALDNAGDAFMLTARSVGQPGFADNLLIRSPAGTLTPNTYAISSNYKFREIGSVKFVPGTYIAGYGSLLTNGFNGIAVNNNFLFTYDGATVKKWNKASGTFVKQLVLGTDTCKWGGLDLSSCDTLYAGYLKTIRVYDSGLNLVSTLPVTDTVFDVKFGLTGILYSCGRKFVSAMPQTGSNQCGILTATVSSTSGSCTTATGSASVNVSGGSGNYNYTWNPGGQTAQTINGIAPGTYTVTVSDKGSTVCALAALQTFTVSVAGGSTLSSTVSSTAVSCTSPGSATVTASAGGGSYTYLWSNGNTSQTNSALSAGTYSVTVTDANGCTSTQSIVVGSGAVPKITNLSKSNVKCNGASGGSITVTATGTGTLTYSWSNGATTLTANNLAAGTYTITVTDNLGCTVVSTAAITEPAALLAPTFTVVNTACGQSNGSVTASASGGTNPLSYNWSNAQTGTSATGLLAGSYSVTVTDKNGCTISATTGVSNSGGPTINSLSALNVLCAGAGDGSVVISASGGVGALSYSWSVTGATGQTISNLSGASYTVSVTDANGCLSTSSVIISEPSALTISGVSTTKADCNQNNGSAVVTATGGTGTFTYNWSNAATSQTNANLSASSYSITVTDANGCAQISVTNVGSNSGPAAVASVLSPILCKGGIGSINLNVTSGTAPYSYSWSSGINGVSNSTNQQLTNLGAGSYSVTVIDAGGCSIVNTINLPQPSLLALGETTKDATCSSSNGSLQVTPTGGVPTYTYTWSTGQTGTSGKLNNLAAGNYSVTVSDANGCTITADTLINETGIGIVNTNPAQQTILEGSSVALSVSGGVTYTWLPVAGLSCTNCPNPLATPAKTTTYTISATDINGCTVTAMISIVVKAPCVGNEQDVFIANVFSPNNDAVNDVLFIEGSGLTNVYWAIYDRWGNLLFETYDQVNGWDGTKKGNPLETGTYVYYLKAICTKTKTEVRLKGNVTLIK